jgi:hypothetical protein
MTLPWTLDDTDDGILTRREVADWLKVKPRQVERLGVPQIDLGRKTKRYLRRDVIRWLEQQRMNKHAGTTRPVGDRPDGDVASGGGRSSNGQRV